MDLGVLAMLSCTCYVLEVEEARLYDDKRSFC